MSVRAREGRGFSCDKEMVDIAFGKRGMAWGENLMSNILEKWKSKRVGKKISRRGSQQKKGDYVGAIRNEI